MSPPLKTKFIAAIAIAAIPFAAALPASATGGFFCKSEDKNVRFEAAAGMQRGGAGGWLNFDSRLEILLKNVPPDFRALHFRSDALTQHWLDNREFKFRLYTERTDGLFGAVEFLVETKAVDEGSYGGRYSLNVENMESEKSTEARAFKARGNIVCSVE